MIYQPRANEMLDKKYFGFREEILNANKILDKDSAKRLQFLMRTLLTDPQLEFRFRRLLSRKLFSQKEMY